jgi:hypothetical protein
MTRSTCLLQIITAIGLTGCSVGATAGTVAGGVVGVGVGATGMVVSGTGKVIGATAGAATSLVTGGSESDDDN